MIKNQYNDDPHNFPGRLPKTYRIKIFNITLFCPKLEHYQVPILVSGSYRRLTSDLPSHALNVKTKTTSHNCILILLSLHSRIRSRIHCENALQPPSFTPPSLHRLTKHPPFCLHTQAPSPPKSDSIKTVPPPQTPSSCFINSLSPNNARPTLPPQQFYDT